MICIVTEYFNTNRILLLAIGMWPYQQSKLVQLQVTLYYCLFISIIVVQFTTFLTTEFTSDLFIKILSIVSYFCLYLVKYNSFGINIQTYIYNELKDEGEIAIIESCGSKVKRYTAILTVLGISCLVIVLIQPWLPFFLNTLLFINGSQSHPSILLITEYFFDQEKYFYLILLHINVVFCLGTFVILATGTMLIACVKFVCVIFKLASYRIEQAMKINIATTIDLKNEIMICNGIIYAVDIHRKAMMLVKFLFSNLNGSLCCLLICIIICLSLNLFQIFQFILLGTKVDELIVHVIVVFVILIYIFIFSYFAQEVLDHNNEIFETVYNTRWYTAPLHIQKMVLFLLQRGTKNISLNVGGLFPISLESTATLISASVSYFTVLCSTRH